jgi:cytochrome b pre-mRNA-processing protein 3
LPLIPGFGRSSHDDAARRLYATIVAQARRPEFFTTLGIPDTLDGRFEMLTLHAFIMLRRLKGQGAEAATLAQAIFDAMFDDMDRSLREMGVGDLGVGRRVKAMAQGFYGRIAAYDRGLAEGDRVLADALRRNVFGTVIAAGEPPAGGLSALCAYIRESERILAGTALADIRAGNVSFPASACPVARED